MKLKTIVSALLVASAGSASAALLVDGFTPGQPSDLLVAVYDDSEGLPNSGKTFLLNTRIKYSDFANGVIGSQTIDLSADPNFQALKAQGAKLKFNIVGGYSLADDFSNYDKTGSSGKPFTDKAGAQWGVVTTGKSKTDFNGDFVNLGDTTKNRIYAYWVAANVKLAAVGATKTSGPDSVLVDKGDPQASFDLAWGGNFGGGGIAKVATANVGTPGETLKFYWVTNTDFDKGAVVELGAWTLSEAGKLVYAGAGGGGGDNLPPVAKAVSSPASPATGADVTLDGSGSSDPNNDPLTYAWTQTSGAAVTLAGGNTAKASFKAVAAGAYAFKLTVSDGKLSSDATVQITVKDPVIPGPSLTLTAPGTWNVSKKDAISFKGDGAAIFKPSTKVTIQYAKNGTKFKTLKTVTNKAGRFVWKPAKADLSNAGVLKAFVKYKQGKQTITLESNRVNIIVNPKQ